MLLANVLQNPLLVIAFVIGLLIAITVHEYAHALIAYRCGDATAKLMGRMTLNPLAHLDPIGTIFLLLVGFGWGKPVPTNPRNYQNRSDEIKVSLAGIVANLLVATILGIPIRIASLKGIMVESNEFLRFDYILVYMNIVIAAFNILPIPPLDGSHIIEYFMDEETKFHFNQYGPFILFALVIFDRISNFSILYAIMEPIIRYFFAPIAVGTFSIFLK